MEVAAAEVPSADLLRGSVRRCFVVSRGGAGWFAGSSARSLPADPADALARGSALEASTLPRVPSSSRCAAWRARVVRRCCGGPDRRRGTRRSRTGPRSPRGSRLRASHLDEVRWKSRFRRTLRVPRRGGRVNLERQPLLAGWDEGAVRWRDGRDWMDVNATFLPTNELS